MQSNRKNDISRFNEELINYIIAIQQIYINELEFDFIDRKFRLDDESPNINLTDILEDKRNILILGEPGSGKTYIAKKILFELTQLGEEKLFDKIPVYLNLSAYKYKFNTISEGILQLLGNYIDDIKIDDIQKLVRDGNFIIILDSLDEVTHQYFEYCINDLRELLQHCPLNKYIITCRENIYSDEFNQLVQPIKLNSLTKDQISKYLKLYCGLKNYEIIPYHYELFENPLLLNIGIEVINANKGKIPNNRSILFNKYIEYLSYKWERKKGLKRKYQLSYYQTILFLSKLSFKLFKYPYISKFQLYEFIAKEHPNKDPDLLFDQIINMGVLKFRADDEIHFRHKTFKEYFAACFIVNVIEETQNFDILKTIIGNKQWYEVFIFSSGLFKTWDIQNYYLDYVLEINLKLYIDSINGKNDFNEYLLSLDIQDYSRIYMEILVDSYEKIITIYFPQIKFLFYPYSAKGENEENLKMYILGQLTEDKKHLYFTFKYGKEQSRVLFLSPHEVNEPPSRKTIFESYYVNLELSGILGDSARIVAIKQIKSQLSRIFENNLLNENPVLICERIADMKRNLSPIRDIWDIGEIYKWVNNELQQAFRRADGVVKGYIYNGVQLTSLHLLSKHLLKEGINLQEHLLPDGDNKTNGVHWVWDLYTKDRLVERVRKFFYFYQLSFIHIVENNFNHLKEYFPDYYHLPYKYIVEIQYNDDSLSEGYRSEPLMTYYYVAADSYEDCMPEILITNKRSGWEEQQERIEKSFRGKERFTKNYSVSNTGVTMTMHERRTGKNLPILSKTYELVSKNLEHIFGKL